MNNGSIEKKTTNVFEKYEQEKEKRQHSQQTTNNPTMTGKEQLHRVKENGKRETSIGTAGMRLSVQSIARGGAISNPHLQCIPFR